LPEEAWAGRRIDKVCSQGGGLRGGEKVTCEIRIPPKRDIMGRRGKRLLSTGNFAQISPGGGGGKPFSLATAQNSYMEWKDRSKRWPRWGRSARVWERRKKGGTRAVMSGFHRPRRTVLCAYQKERG